MLQVGIAALIINLFLLELIPFIYVKSFGCPDYLANEDRTTAMSLNKFFMRMMALVLSFVAGFLLYGATREMFFLYMIIGTFLFTVLSAIGWPAGKFLFFQSFDLEDKCKDFKPKFKLSNK